jgi:predicted RNA-binding Zn ribbon-like protein
VEFLDYADWAISLANSGRDGDRPDPLDSVKGLKALLRQVIYGGHRVAETDLEPLRELREQLRSVFEAPTPEAAATRLNRVFGVCEFAPNMAYSREQGWHLHPASDRTPAWRWLAAACALGLTYLLMDYGAERLGVCAAPGCGKVFLDRSRPGNKRFCSLRCANRMHASAFRRRGRLEDQERSGVG